MRGFLVADASSGGRRDPSIIVAVRRVQSAPGLPDRQERIAMKKLSLILAGLLLLGVLGCSQEGQKKTGMPSLAHPGSGQVQQKRALRYDPYPESSVSGGNMDGTRPRDYQYPPAEPTRARWGTNENLSSYPNSERWGTQKLDPQ
jgi:hypothetical protein